MIEVKTFSFRLRVEKNNVINENCMGKYFLVLSCESPFDVNKSFSEEFFSDSDLTPFFDLTDVLKFAEEMATFWKIRLIINPKLDITRLEEMSDIWNKLLVEIRKEISNRKVA